MIKNNVIDNNKENGYFKNRIVKLEVEVKKQVSKKGLNQDDSILRKILEHKINAFYRHTANHKLTYFS